MCGWPRTRESDAAKSPEAVDRRRTAVAHRQRQRQQRSLAHMCDHAPSGQTNPAFQLRDASLVPIPNRHDCCRPPTTQTMDAPPRATTPRCCRRRCPSLGRPSPPRSRSSARPLHLLCRHRITG
uniref:Predicted protein n=2 Tax=Hordeum vulgare subsp. vulgare TaxID=112509 RepID=F2EC92_HORVV|nr:predicted protein [Hordeum vulgare subsp. vulgare]